ncbi:MAG TPA: urease accessory protein UreF [Rhodospirillaceae bacterium]|nr:urease accessory protein UreF [Magnetovibrio sp.]HCS69548.1 urease accessory protein UreF [Rhodospirillaceae bacterium]
MIMPMTIIMGMEAIPMDSGSLYRLLAWLSPGYPVGAFAYSHGLEWAVETGAVADRAGLERWLRDLLAHGGAWSDAVLFARSHDAAAGGGAGAALAEINDLAVALCPSSERRLETTAQGNAFLLATRASWPWDDDDTDLIPGDCAYPVAVAWAAAGHGLPLGPALHAYVHAVAANLISAGVRLIPLGQTDGQRVLAALEDAVAQTAAAAQVADLAALGGCAFLSDVAAMRHETQYTRLFRS